MSHISRVTFHSHLRTHATNFMHRSHVTHIWRSHVACLSSHGPYLSSHGSCFSGHVSFMSQEPCHELYVKKSRTTCEKVMSHKYDEIHSYLRSHVPCLSSHSSSLSSYFACLRSQRRETCMNDAPSAREEVASHTYNGVMSRVLRVMAHISRVMLHVSGASDVKHVWTMHQLYVRKSYDTYRTESCPVSFESWLISLELCCMYQEPATWNMYERCTNCTWRSHVTHI